MLREVITISTPKTPKKDAATVRLEQEQINSLNQQKVNAANAIALRRKKVVNQSLGRRSLLRTSETGIDAIAIPSATPVIEPKPIITTGG